MAEGIAAMGDHVTRCRESDYDGQLRFDVVVFYGLQGNTPQMFFDYRTQRKAVYVDLGYWGRREGGRWTGYHKVSINDRHPTAYFQAIKHPADRVARFGLHPVVEFKGGRHILLAGMGDKGALAEGFQPEAWERAVINEIRKVSDRPIRYRPKPSWKEARPIEGTEYSPPHAREVEHDLRDCWAVVTHHSNVALEAMLAGIPAFCWSGVMKNYCRQDLSGIELVGAFPYARYDVDQLLADIAYTQWSVAEMRQGLAWNHLKQEGLLR